METVAVLLTYVQYLITYPVYWELRPFERAPPPSPNSYKYRGVETWSPYVQLIQESHQDWVGAWDGDRRPAKDNVGGISWAWKV